MKKNTREWNKKGPSKGKKVALIAGAVAVALVGVCATGCTKNKEYTITLDGDAIGFSADPIKLKSGTPIKEIVPPTIRGWYFEGYYSDADRKPEHRLDENSEINADTKIYLNYEQLIYKLTITGEDKDLITVIKNGDAGHDVTEDTPFALDDTITLGYVLTNGYVKTLPTFKGLEIVGIESSSPVAEGTRYTAVYKVVGSGTNSTLADAELNISYTQVAQQFTITYLTEDGQPFTTRKAPYHSKDLDAVYNLKDGPAKAPTNEWTYRFAGWAMEGETDLLEWTTYNLEGDIRVKAVYEQSAREYPPVYAADCSADFIKIYRVSDDPLVQDTLITNPHWNDKIRIEYDESKSYFLDHLYVNDTEVASGYTLTVNGEINIRYTHTYYEYGYLKFAEVDGGWAVVDLYDTTKTSVVIPDTFRDDPSKPVVAIGNNAFKDDKIESVTFGVNITKIGDYAFKNTKLKTINIPDYVEGIGVSAFEGVKSSTDLYVGSGVKTIGKAAFKNLTKLERLTYNVTDSVVVYTEGTDSTGNKQTKGIGVFVGMGTELTNGTEIAFGDNCLNIPAHLFNSNSSSGFNNIKNIVINDNIQTVGDYAFRYCKVSDSIYIGRNVQKLGHNVFDLVSGSKLSKVTYAAVNAKTASDEGKTTISLFKGWDGKGTTTIDTSIFNFELEITDDVTTISENIFKGCYATTITLGKNITEIGKNAFQNTGWVKILNYNIPKFENTVNVDGWFKSIGKGVDEGTQINFGADVESLPSRLFYGSSDGSSSPKLGNVIIPANITFIGEKAFGQLQDVKTVTIESNDIYISITNEKGAGELFKCSAITAVRVPLTIEDVTPNAYLNDIANGFYKIDDDNYYVFTKDPELAFGRFEYVEETDGTLTINGLKSEYANSQHIIIPNVYEDKMVAKIADSAFENYTNLKSVTILGSSLKVIGANAFNGCTNVKAFTVPSSVETIGANAFNDTNILIAEINSASVYSSLTDANSNAIGLVINATDVTVPYDVVKNNTSAYLENSNNFRKILFEDPNDATIKYYLFTTDFEKDDLYKFDYLELELSTSATDGSEFYTVTKVNTTQRRYDIDNNLTDIPVTEVIIPDDINGKPVLIIRADAFGTNEVVTSVSIGKNVEYLPISLFDGCTNLQRVIIKSPKVYSQLTFGDVTNPAIINNSEISIYVKGNGIIGSVDDQGIEIHNTILEDETKYTQSISMDPLYQGYIVFTKIPD